MAVLNGRIDRLERIYGEGDGPGRLVTIAPESWSDDDRHAWQVAGIRHDGEAKADLIETYAGVRPGGDARYFNAIIMPAPEEIEQADEATRAAWRAVHQIRPWTPERGA